MNVLTKQHLLARLKEEKLPSSYHSLIKYEKLGIVPLPESMNGVGAARNWRLYSPQEVEIIIKKIREYTKSWPSNIKSRSKNGGKN